MTTIQQLPEQLNIPGCKWVTPSRQTPSKYYTKKLFSGLKIFSFYPPFRVRRDILKKQLGC